MKFLGQLNRVCYGAGAPTGRLGLLDRVATRASARPPWRCSLAARRGCLANAVQRDAGPKTYKVREVGENNAAFQRNLQWSAPAQILAVAPTRAHTLCAAIVQCFFHVRCERAKSCAAQLSRLIDCGSLSGGPDRKQSTLQEGRTTMSQQPALTADQQKINNLWAKK